MSVFGKEHVQLAADPEMARLLSPRELRHKLLVKGKRLPSVFDGFSVAAPGGDGSDSEGSHNSDEDEERAFKELSVDVMVQKLSSMAGVYTNKTAKQLFDEYMSNLDGEASASVNEAIFLWGSDLPAKLAVWSRRAASGRKPDLGDVEEAVQYVASCSASVRSLQRACLRAFADAAPATPPDSPPMGVPCDSSGAAAAGGGGTTWLPGAAAFEEHIGSGKATRATPPASRPGFSRQPSGAPHMESLLYRCASHPGPRSAALGRPHPQLTRTHAPPPQAPHAPRLRRVTQRPLRK